MAGIFAFRCSCCGELHEGSPNFGFNVPDQYASLTEEQKAQLAKLSDDFCVLNHGESTLHFIRAILEIPIHGVHDPFVVSLWVSVSEESFNRYVQTDKVPVEGDGFFGWISNAISLYPTSNHRPADVYIQTDGTLPKVVLHTSDPELDQLAIDQCHGISIERAQQLAEQAMHG